MKRWYLALLLSLLWPLSAAAFEDTTLAVEANQYAQQLQPRKASADPMAVLRKVERFSAQKLYPEAIRELETLTAVPEQSFSAWLQLAQLWKIRDAAKAKQSAYNAYGTASDDSSKARALYLLGELYENDNQIEQALAAWQEALGLEENPSFAKRYETLKAKLALKAESIEVTTDGPKPQVCVVFNNKLKNVGRSVHFEDYITVEPTIQAEASARGERLCISGVQYGQKYKVSVRPGVPGADGSRSASTASFDASIEDREASVGFRGNAYVLPRNGAHLLPLTTVNVNKVKLQLLRVNDRNLVQKIIGRQYGQVGVALDGYDISDIMENAGELLWQGQMDIKGERNQDVTTGIPSDEILKQTKPGVYALAAVSVDETDNPDEYDNRATQWLVVSDLGLTTFQGSDGLHVFTRSLDNAQPISGVQLTLYARNNSELATARSDEQGHVRFDPGLLRGNGGNTPLLIMASGAQGDFNFLDLSRSAFDLSDRGVDGRAAPGAVDTFMYTERGVYRPGEQVELVAMTRDPAAKGLENLPLTIKLFRPDETEAEQFTLKAPVGGAHHLTIPLANNSRTGGWRASAFTDPKNGSAVGEVRFQVEDFVPQQLKLELASEALSLAPEQSAELSISGRFLYGAPAAELKLEGELVLREDPDPFPMWKGYQFGLVQDSYSAQRFPLEDLSTTDAEGKASVELSLNERPDTTKPLKAIARISLFEPGGRAVIRSYGLPYQLNAFSLGIKPRFGTDALPIKQPGEMDVIAVDAQGKPLAVDGLHYELLREDYEYYWYYEDSRWDFKSITRDGSPISNGTLSVSADKPGLVQFKGLDWGYYRLEVYDPKTNVASSTRFRVGWFVDPVAGDTPDKLQVTLDKTSYNAGDNAKVFIKAPFAGEVLLTIASDKLWLTQNVTLKDDQGTTVTLPVKAEWGPGVYVTATAFRPGKTAERGPGRAIGLAWMPLDPASRTLQVTMDAPKELVPRQVFNLPVQVQGLAGKSGYITVAAVDEGVLQLTDFISPDPLKYYLGKRRLGVDIRDLYGRLIEPGGRPGQLRSGGDADSRNLDGSSVRPTKTVTMFSGIVKLDAQGRASIPLDLPDFNGELRLMAVAWDGERLGKAAQPLLVRDPLIARTYLPRFLAPSDTAQITLSLQNLSAAVGEYKVKLQASGPLALEGASDYSFRVTDSAKQTSEQHRIGLRAIEPGLGALDLTVDGPNGFRLERHYDLSVRPTQPYVSERDLLRVGANEPLKLDNTLVAQYVPSTVELNVSLSSRPNLDIPGLLARLDRYPYGCLEQTTSRALPLLYLDEVSRSWLGKGTKDANDIGNRIQGAIRRVLGMQNSTGGFGLWGPDGEAGLWASSYALDFLVRAREKGYLVPDVALNSGLDWLQGQVNQTDYEKLDTLPAHTYALYVLARAQKARIGDLRYLHDNHIANLKTPLARAQLGAALARYGDQARAREAFQRALALFSDDTGWRDYWYGYYGSPLRDRAAVLALAGEVGQYEAEILRLARDLVRLQDERGYYTSTQEDAWLLMAANVLAQGNEPLKVALDGQTLPTGKGMYRLALQASDLAQGQTLTNQGGQPIWAALSSSGIPAKPLPAEEKGFTISRAFYTRDGKPVDLAKVKQNDRLVVVIKGKVKSGEQHQALVVDLLPSGLEIQNARLAHEDSTDELSWLPELTDTQYSEPRDDRFVAALDVSGGQDFTLAYQVRAVTPGAFQVPAVFIEDMYKPWYYARGASSQMSIK